jgi:uncharacterized RDD family membrane protein YckC
MDTSRETSTGRGDWSTETDEQERAAPDVEMTDVTGGRIVAQLTDSMFLGAQLLAVWAVLQSVLGLGSGHDLVLYASLTLPLYGGLLEGLWNGQTVGKRLMRIKVVDGDGPPSVLQAFVRNLSAAFLFGAGMSPELIAAGAVVPLLAGLAVIALSDRRQRLLDHLVGTYVVAVDDSVVDHEPKRYRMTSPDDQSPWGESGW